MGLPFLYIPDEHFFFFMEVIKNQFAEQEVVCNYTLGYCKFMKNCGEFRTSLGANDTIINASVPINWDISWNQYKNEQGNSKLIKTLLDGNDLANGTLFGDSYLTCYFPVFRSNMEDQQTWFIGNVILEKYYTVFDMTPLDERE
jgi:hypothetical protein